MSEDDKHDRYEQHHDMSEEEITAFLQKEVDKVKKDIEEKKKITATEARQAKMRASLSKVDFEKEIADLRVSASISPLTGAVKKVDVLMLELLLSIDNRLKETNRQLEEMNDKEEYA